MKDANRDRVVDHYEEVSEQLFIFYTQLIKAGFSKDEAFTLVNSCVNRSAIEQTETSVTRRVIENARLSEKLREMTRREN